MTARPDTCIIAVALMLAAVAIGWTGYIASDDASYYLGAQQWLRDPPFAGSDHWTTRFPVVLTLAAAIGVIGPGPLPLAVTALGGYALFLTAAAMLAARVAGQGLASGRVALPTVLLLGTMPLIATSASIVNCDLPEVAFLLAGLALLAPEARDGSPRRTAAVGAGVAFGLAVLCRETALLGLTGLGILFLVAKPVSRASLLVAAAGAAGVLGAEMLFQLAVTGDPLHRYALAFNHDATLDRAADLEGNLLVHPLLDPLLVLFLNNEFAALFPLAAVALAARAHRHLDGPGRRALLLPAAAGLAAFALVALLGGKLVLNPRYFTLTAFPAALLVAVWLDRMSPRRRWPLLAGAIIANLLMLSVQNAYPRWPSTALARAAAAHPDATIFAAPEIVRRAELELTWANLRNVTAAPDGATLRLVEEGTEGAPIARYPTPPTPLGRLAIAAGIAGLIPDRIARRLLAPGPTMLLVRAGG